MSSRSFFSAGSPYLTHPLLTAERTAREVDTILELTESTTGSVLDVGCGFGRHSIEFARRNRDVTGIDPSQIMIAAARERAENASVSVDFQQAGAVEFHANELFSLAICLFTTLGQRDPADDQMARQHNSGSDPEQRMLESIAAALAPGSPLVLEVPDKSRTLESLVTHEQLGQTTVERRFDDETLLIHETFQTAPGTSFALTYRISTFDQMHDLLVASGFDVRHARHHGLVEPPATFTTFIAHKSS